MPSAISSRAPIENATEPQGSLDQTSVPRLLAEAWRDKRTGWLRLSRGKSERRIQVRDGSPYTIESSLETDDFAQTLEDRGLIGPQDRIEIERLARDRTIPQASAVLALKKLDAKVLYKAIRNATRNQICETFEWQTGVYLWTPASENIEVKGKPHDILNLLQMELPQRWGSDRLFESLMPSADCYGEIAPCFRRVAEQLACASEHARNAIARLDGSVRVGQILGESAGDPLAASTLWTLLHAGILRMRAERRSLEIAPMEIQIEVETESSAGQAGTAASARSSAKSSARNAAAPSETNARSASMRVEIQTLLEALPDLDHYDALGLTPESSPGDVKRAYFKAAKKFHPDALARLGLEDLRDVAARVFARIAEAFETLSDPSKKAAYDADGRGEPEIDTARLAQAETSYRKGEILLRMGNFEGALEFLEPAVELWPDEPAYQSGLGWALYKRPRPDAARAREHLEIAAAQAPDVAVILFRLSVVLRGLGEVEAGDAMVARARALEPALEE